jgi:hypothetical protein
MLPLGPKRRKTTSARMSAIDRSSGLVVLDPSFVDHDLEQSSADSRLNTATAGSGIRSKSRLHTVYSALMLSSFASWAYFSESR